MVVEIDYNRTVRMRNWVSVSKAAARGEASRMPSASLSISCLALLDPPVHLTLAAPHLVILADDRCSADEQTPIWIPVETRETLTTILTQCNTAPHMKRTKACANTRAEKSRVIDDTGTRFQGRQDTKISMPNHVCCTIFLGPVGQVNV